MLGRGWVWEAMNAAMSAPPPVELLDWQCNPPTRRRRREGKLVDGPRDPRTLARFPKNDKAESNIDSAFEQPPNQKEPVALGEGAPEVATAVYAALATGGVG